MRILLELYLAGCFFSSWCGAATFYVDPGGNDFSPGTSDAPYRTVMRGVQAAGPGDTVMVRDGVYGHENSISKGDGADDQASPVTLRRSGRPDAWIAIEAEHKWGAILDCELLCDAYIDLANAAYIVVQGFVITRGYKEGIHSNDAAHNIILRGNRIEYIAGRDSQAKNGLDGIYTNSNCHDFIIEGNVFHDIGRTNPSRLDHGLYLRGSGYAVVNNVFYNINNGWSIQLAEGIDNVLIANNTFVSDGRSGQAGQIILWNSESNVAIRNNIFSRPLRSAIVRYRATLTNCTIDHNLVFGSATLMPDGSGCATSSNQIGVDPMFSVGPNPWDLYLQPGSPAIRAGTPVTGLFYDFLGLARALDSAPDLGAYAFVQ